MSQDPPAPPLKRVGKRSKRPTTSSSSRAALRAIIAEHETRCAYCRVPTAATIEHVVPVAEGGRSVLSNLVLSCPHCNTLKRDRSVSEFLASGDWKIKHPELPASAEEMLRGSFGIELVPGEETRVKTNSAHADLLIRSDRSVAILVRPGKGYAWRRTEMGALSDDGIAPALYDFLARHHTPKTPR